MTQIGPRSERFFWISASFGVKQVNGL